MTQPGTDNGERTVPAAGITAQNFEPFIRKHTVAERMEVKIRTVNRLMREKVLGHYKLGQIVRFKWSEVENDLRKHRRVGFDTTPLETKEKLKAEIQRK
jgi:excisionase family DNA binding protein